MTDKNLSTNLDLLTSSYTFDLPNELIAQRPNTQRDACRLLAFAAHEPGQMEDLIFHQLIEKLPANSLLVFNHSKVIPSRLFGKKASGGGCEILILDPHAPVERVPCFLRSNGKKRVGDQFIFQETLEATIVGREEEVFLFDFKTENLIEVLDEVGKIPIPPYIRDGVSDAADVEDYQTVYAEKDGSIAAPTAGLHFTPELIAQFKAAGHDVANVCLHVGAGTFAPVKSDDLSGHKMHTEKFEIEEDDYLKIKQAKNIIAVGTTSLRVLESIWDKELKFKNIAGKKVYSDETSIFLHPGVEVKSIDGIITNFHLPESTLLMLVSSLIGREQTLKIYAHAIEKKYLFYSYGDAMFIHRNREEN